MEDNVVVLVTVGNMENAEKIAHTLVDEHLAACVNVVPEVRSFYRWEGKVADDRELLLIIKTRSRLFDRLKDRVLALHEYELPEVIGLGIEKGHQAYLDWIAKETEQDG
ncbi:MAG: divalent-cation tolerance protein CutA [Planctomycetota bacterium]|jgi:periplasmic divalent cation tolerance protein